jgi:hypothetical protein
MKFVFLAIVLYVTCDGQAKIRVPTAICNPTNDASIGVSANFLQLTRRGDYITLFIYIQGLVSFLLFTINVIIIIIFIIMKWA